MARRLSSATLVHAALLLAAANGLQAARRGMARSATRAAARAAVSMSALKPGGNVLAVGNGPVFLLAAKTAAAAGYPTTIVSARTELFNQLLWAEDEDRDANLRILGVTEDEDVTAFNEAVASADALIVAFDAEQTLTDTLLDVVLPAEGGASRVACLSKHLSGKGMGPFVTASKVAANKEVWCAPPERVEMYRSFEAKLKAKVAAKGGDVTIVRGGTLKGGGPGDPESVQAVAPTLAPRFYAEIVADLVNWQLLFDCETRGVELTPGDSAAGPGLQAVFTATASDARPGDSGRVQVAQALVRSLALDGAAGKEFGVTTKAARDHPSDGEWEAEFAKVL